MIISSLFHPSTFASLCKQHNCSNSHVREVLTTNVMETFVGGKLCMQVGYWNLPDLAGLILILECECTLLDWIGPTHRHTPTFSKSNAKHDILPERGRHLLEVHDCRACKP
jgi:hypothetical protein